jgi:hypothetical protein
MVDLFLALIEVGVVFKLCFTDAVASGNVSCHPISFRKAFLSPFLKTSLGNPLQRLEETAVGNNPIEAMRTFPDDDFHNGCELRRATSIVNVT